MKLRYYISVLSTIESADYLHICCAKCSSKTLWCLTWAMICGEPRKAWRCSNFRTAVLEGSISQHELQYIGKGQSLFEYVQSVVYFKHTVFLNQCYELRSIGTGYPRIYYTSSDTEIQTLLVYTLYMVLCVKELYSLDYHAINVIR